MFPVLSLLISHADTTVSFSTGEMGSNAERDRMSRQAVAVSADPDVLARQQSTREQRRDRERLRWATVAASSSPDVVA